MMRWLKARYWQLHAALTSWAVRRLWGHAPQGIDEWRAAGLSHAQIGEDRVIRHLLACAGIGQGVYVDAGAFHPVRYSNTLLLYDAGWRGVNVDASPEAIALFEQRRPRDRNVCAALSDTERAARYVRYPEGATNRLADHDDERSLLGEAPLAAEAVTTRTLTSVLDEHGVDRVDLLTVDCEGEDLRVLRGFDFTRWRPVLVAVEAHTDPERADVAGFLEPLGYTRAARVVVTEIYTDARRG